MVDDAGDRLPLAHASGDHAARAGARFEKGDGNGARAAGAGAIRAASAGEAS